MFIAAASALIVTLTFPHGPAKVGLQCSEEVVSLIKISMALDKIIAIDQNKKVLG